MSTESKPRHKNGSVAKPIKKIESGTSNKKPGKSSRVITTQQEPSLVEDEVSSNLNYSGGEEDKNGPNIDENPDSGEGEGDGDGPSRGSRVSGNGLTVKKGPGRPRKTPKKMPLPRKGIVNTPHRKENIIEFLYDSPEYIRRIIAFFKFLASQEIQILFRPSDVIFFGYDHSKNSRIYVRIDCSKINHYYCTGVYDMGFSTRELGDLFNKVNREYRDVAITSTISGIHKNIEIVFDNEIEIDERHIVDLIGQYNHLDNEGVFLDESYSIEFQLPYRYFKKTMGDIRIIANQISIIQNSCDDPVEIQYTSDNKKTRSRHIIKNPKKIKLISNITDNFRVEMKIDNIKPISAGHFAENIIIKVDENKQFMTKAVFDNDTITIKTLTKIIDERNG